MPTNPVIDPTAPIVPTTAMPAVPMLEEIGRLRPGERLVFRGVDWGFYERLHRIIGERPGLRIAFNGRDVEVMPTSRRHEQVKDFAFRLIEILTEELDIRSESMGSTTWMRPELARGIEADQSYYFSVEKIRIAVAAQSRHSNEIVDYPDPDLAIEIDISEPQVDRSGIYAALRVPEVWRFRESGTVIDRLNDRGTYESVDRSAFLPITAEELSRWILREDRSSLQDWKRRLRAWIRA